MNPAMLEYYRSYKDHRDREAGLELAGIFYRQLNYWIENGKPASEFIEDFWDLFSSIQESISSTTDLVDLGLVQTAEAISSYRHDDNTQAMSEFYIYEARLPFFAFIDENGYRMMKNIEFSEIDFHIYEIIGGDFPHEVAQSFLHENEWADIWTSLRYLDSLEEQEDRMDILETMLERRRTIQEKIIVLAYLFYSENEHIPLTDSNDHEVFIPDEISPEFLDSVLKILEDYYNGNGLKVSWEENIIPRFHNETIFFLLAFFEITQSELSPAWIGLLEQGLATVWTYPFPEPDGTVKVHQPIQEFSASILNLLGDEDLFLILETSRVLSLFFERINQYNNESFQQYISAFSRREDLLLNELTLAIPGNINQDREKEILQGRLQEIASYIGREIKIQNGVPLIMHSDGSIN